MNSTSAANAEELKSLGLEDVASQRPLFFLVFTQLYLLFLVVSGRSTFSQVMLMAIMENLFVWLLTLLFFSRTWAGVAQRCRDLMILAAVQAIFMVIFCIMETTWGTDTDTPFAPIAAMMTSHRFVYALGYLGILTAGWLVMAWESGRAKIWWGVNVGAPAAVIFAGMFVACFAGGALLVILSMLQEGLAKLHIDARHFVQVVHDFSPMLLLILYILTRVFMTWKMITTYTAENWRKAIASFYFDQPAEKA
jgi:hypothetical protein